MEKEAAEKTKRSEPFKKELDFKFIKALSLAETSGWSPKGEFVFKTNPKVLNRKHNPDFVASYILWDTHRSAPPGFSVRIADKKTFIIRRKVLGRSIMPTVGNRADFLSINVARKRAAC